jgi:CheY-like chemotaxis protein
MSEGRPKIIVVDDDAEVRRQAGESLEIMGGGADVVLEGSFSEGLRRIETESCDVAVLDLRNMGDKATQADPEAGNRVAESIRKHRFVPIVFYTALPTNVLDMGDTPFVAVVPKTEGVLRLREEVETMLATGVPQATRAVDEHVDAVRRDFLWEFSTASWGRLRHSLDANALSYLLARRLAASLSVSGMESVNAGLGPLLAAEEYGGAHPHFFYVLPPVERGLQFGDVVKEKQTYYVVLSATCDLVSSRKRKAKADRVLLGRCKRVSTQPEYKKAKGDSSKKGRRDLLGVMRNNANGRQKDRCFFLPPALDVPALLLDLQELQSEKLSGVKKLERIASMDSPFAEMLTSQLSRYYGRVGAPDLNVGAIADGLLS